MGTKQGQSQARRGFHLTDICAAILLLTASIVLFGWIADYRPLTSFSASISLPTMKVNAAISFIMLGIGLLALRQQYQRLVIFCSITTLLIASCALIELIFDVNLGINDLFLDDKWSSEAPGRMAFASAVGFTLAAGLLLGHQLFSNKHPLFYSVLMVIYLIAPLLAVNNYAATANALNSIGFFSTYSLPSTILFLVFITGLAGVTHNGFCSIFQEQDGTCRQFRRALLTIGLAIIVFSLGSTLLVGFEWSSTQLILVVFNTTLILLMLYFVAICYRVMHTQQRKNPTGNLHSDEKDKALLEVLSAADEGIVLIDERRHILRANEGASKIFGWLPEELIGNPVEMLVPIRYRSSDIGQFHNFLASDERCRNFDNRGKAIGLTNRGHEKPVSIALHKCKKITASGDVLDLHSTPEHEHADTLLDNSDVFVVAIFRELSGLESELAELNHRVQIDHLTGLPNQYELEKYCRTFEEHALRKQDEHICLMIIDMDSFKLVNNRYDREFGDRVLQTITGTLKHRLRKSDTLFRYGDDTFVLVSLNTAPDKAELMAERMRTSVKVTPTKLDEKNVYITCSIGVCITNDTKVDLMARVELLYKELHSSIQENKDSVTIFPWISDSP
ncbi:sensor domain-containing diguanylate cyclase [Teredinibacter haidensis]|uniref:sensor domain-containing diguanylate cyclase n=1 Tax=Teredinibacter haidensis TaxID=2731755 RepID=UPI000948E4E7|nr:sensor domain-containing diguanylate cyclase [Teredinibacter haidensis]